MLAMYVILQSSLQMVCDYPDAYKGQPGFEFIQKIPTVWDKTKVIDASAGEWLIIARKKNEDWYIGTITNNAKRQIKLNFNFLPEGKYTAEIYSDAPDSDVNPNNLIKEVITLSNTDAITVNLAGGGGQVIHLVPHP
jgi:alpha-glucosidase